MQKKQFEGLYAELSPQVYRYSFSLLSNKEDAEDVTADSFIKLFNRLEAGESIENPKAWLLTVSRNDIYNRFASARKKWEQTLEGDESIVEIEDVDVETSMDTEISSELRELILAELENLDPSTKEIIIFKIWEELQFKQISEIVKLKESAVKLRYYRGLEKIKMNIEKDRNYKKKYSIALPLLASGIKLLRENEKFKLVNFNSLKLKIMQSAVSKSAGFGKLALAASVSLALVAVIVAGIFIAKNTSTPTLANTMPVAEESNTPTTPNNPTTPPTAEFKCANPVVISRESGDYVCDDGVRFKLNDARYPYKACLGELKRKIGNNAAYEQTIANLTYAKYVLYTTLEPEGFVYETARVGDSCELVYNSILDVNDWITKVKNGWFYYFSVDIDPGLQEIKAPQYELFNLRRKLSAESINGIGSEKKYFGKSTFIDLFSKVQFVDQEVIVVSGYNGEGTCGDKLGLYNIADYKFRVIKEFGCPGNPQVTKVERFAYKVLTVTLKDSNGKVTTEKVNY